MDPDVVGLLGTATGTVFVSAALTKLLRRNSIGPFLEELGLSSAISNRLTRLVAASECLVGAGLVVGTFTLPAALVATAMTSFFCLLLGGAYLRGVRVSCGCFGPFDATGLPIISIFRAAALFALAVTVSISNAGASLMTYPFFLRSPWFWLIGVFVGLAFVGMFSLVEQIWSFESGRRRLIAEIASGYSRSPLTVQSGGLKDDNALLD